jgi:uncharacterized protein YkwD
VLKIKGNFSAGRLVATWLGVGVLALGAASSAAAASFREDPLAAGCWVSEATGRPLPPAVLEGRDAIVDPADPNRLVIRGAPPASRALVAVRAPCGRSARQEPEPGLNPAVLAEINLARADPRAYAAKLRVYLTAFQGRFVQEPGRPVATTVEGPAAVVEAIADLERRAAAPPLTADGALARAAGGLLADQQTSGREGHMASDGSGLSDRMRQAKVFAMETEEDIAYGGSTPAEVVRKLIVDDGVPDRGHRLSIFDPHMSHAGAACGSHARWGWVCVVDLAGGMMPGPGSRTGH